MLDGSGVRGASRQHRWRRSRGPPYCDHAAPPPPPGHARPAPPGPGRPGVRGPAPADRAPAEPVASETRSATPDIGRRTADAGGRAPAAERPPAHGATRLARLAAREALSREAGSTYLDSLILSTDSVVRRWPDRWGSPIRVAIMEGGPRRLAPRMAGYVRTSLDRWEGLGIGVRFALVARHRPGRHPGALDRSLRLRSRGPDRPDLGPVGSGAPRAGVARPPDQHRRRPARRRPALGGRARDRPRDRPAALRGLQRRHVPRHAHRRPLRPRPPHRRACSTACRPAPSARRRTIRGRHPSFRSPRWRSRRSAPIPRTETARPSCHRA